MSDIAYSLLRGNFSFTHHTARKHTPLCKRTGVICKSDLVFIRTLCDNKGGFTVGTWRARRTKRSNKQIESLASPTMNRLHLEGIKNRLIGSPANMSSSILGVMCHCRVKKRMIDTQDPLANTSSLAGKQSHHPTKNALDDDSPFGNMSFITIQEIYVRCGQTVQCTVGILLCTADKKFPLSVYFNMCLRAPAFAILRGPGVLTMEVPAGRKSAKHLGMRFRVGCETSVLNLHFLWKPRFESRGKGGTTLCPYRRGVLVPFLVKL